MNLTGGPLARVALAVSIAILAAIPATASAGPRSPVTAAVSMGDSFIGGQAGRWQGNSHTPTGSRSGTDRACVRTLTGCRYEVGRVYLGNTKPPGCARSDVAEIHSTRIGVNETINIACSGGQTENIHRASSGGRALKGDAPQADQLARIARERAVKLIALAIGGNDIGFTDIAVDCVLAYGARAGPCTPEQRPLIESRLPAAMAGVAKALEEIRAVMRAAGYRPWHYRLVLQSYTPPVPRAAENRYPEMDLRRELVGGSCPLYDKDLNFVRDELAPRLDRELRAVALRMGVQFLSLKDALQGREMCARTARLADRQNPPSPVTSEWARFISLSAILQGNTIEEEGHPNAYGQRALGNCLTRLYGRTTGSWACTNTPGRGTDAMTLSRISSAPGRFALHLRVSPRRVRAGRRCFRFRALSGGVPVENVTIRVAGRRRGRTRTNGRLRRCMRLRKGTYRARATRTGFRPVSVGVRVRRAQR